MPPRPLRILTWHVHGSYLYYLSRIPHELLLPVDADRTRPGYGGRTPSYPWPATVREVPVAEIPRTSFDCILFQSRDAWATDQYELLSSSQRALPRIYLEHDPPREHPTDTCHWVTDPETTVVHVTHFNRLMWDNGAAPVRVIPHGVLPGEHLHTGERARGITVINNIRRRGRRLGADLLAEARRELPIDLVGMGWEEADGLGEIRHADLPAFLAPYRFFFNPIRYTSLGLSICEAMMAGLPIVGLATTELAVTIENGISGFVHTDQAEVIAFMKELLHPTLGPTLARELGHGARRAALQRFHIDRFVQDWDRVLREVAGGARPRAGNPVSSGLSRASTQTPSKTGASA